METTKNTTEETVVTEEIVENTEVVLPPDNPKKALKEKLKQSFKNSTAAKFSLVKASTALNRSWSSSGRNFSNSIKYLVIALRFVSFVNFYIALRVVEIFSIVYLV